jgi:signal transduction histidine kinase
MIDGDMGATHTAAPRREPLRRDPAHGLVAGVCAGIGRHLRIDPLIVRIVFVAAATAGGVGILLYAVAWVLMPVDDAAAGSTSAWVRRLPRGRGAIEVAIGMGLVTLAFLLTMRALGIWFSDVIVWPVVLLSAGAALLWRQSLRPAPTPVPEQKPAAPDEERRERTEVLSRNGVGATLVIAAGIAFLAATHALTAARDVILAVLVVAIVLGIIFAPWVLRLVRSLAAEREERIRSQARAEMGAHLHDSVLQTLALVQKRADDPRAVAALARTQERELRAWLAGREGAHDRLAAALEAVAGEVERAHGVPVEIVVVGDRALDGRGEALVAAAREAMVNAAKFGGGSPVDVYAEASDDALQVFVRDRGPGFDPDAVPADRRGVRESIVGRMARHGGRAAISSAPGAGTEVELTIPGTA